MSTSVYPNDSQSDNSYGWDVGFSPLENIVYCFEMLLTLEVLMEETDGKHWSAWLDRMDENVERLNAAHNPFPLVIRIVTFKGYEFAVSEFNARYFEVSLIGSTAPTKLAAKTRAAVQAAIIAIYEDLTPQPPTPTAPAQDSRCVNRLSCTQSAIPARTTR